MEVETVWVIGRGLVEVAVDLVEVGRCRRGGGWLSGRGGKSRC